MFVHNISLSGFKGMQHEALFPININTMGMSAPRFPWHRHTLKISCLLQALDAMKTSSQVAVHSDMACGTMFPSITDKSSYDLPLLK
jgi:hypothetical protein